MPQINYVTAMNKALPFVLFVVVAGIIAYALMTGGGSKGGVPLSSTPIAQSSAAAVSSGSSSVSSLSSSAASGPALNPLTQISPHSDQLSGDQEGFDDRTATEIYKNADDALAAVKKGAVSYDDLIIEQFTEPGEDCSWCNEFYKQVKDLLAQDSTPQDQKSYYAELLAISGRTANIEALVEAIKSAKTPESADLYAEALELSQGKEAVVNYLGTQLDTTNETLKDSLVAALTNQSSRSAAEMLYKQTVKANDPDGYYSKGIGLGEFIPDPDSFPYLQDLVTKRDQYSHLAVKSLLNSGAGGLRVVLDVLSNAKDPNSDRALLKDATDHVIFDEETEPLLKKTLETSKNPVVIEFVKQILDEHKAEESAADSVEE